jgi:beta-carotene hydroxylase
MFEHQADRRTVAIGSAIVVLGVLPYLLRPATAWAIGWVPIAAVLSLSAWSIVHNQIHHRIFRRELDALNTAWSAWIALATGHPPTSLVETHCYNHHLHVGGPGDWSRPQNSGMGWGVVRCLRYAVLTAVRMGRGRRTPEARRLSRRLRLRLRIEQAFLYTTAVVVCALDPRIFLSFTLPTWIGGTVLFMGVNLLQHDGCEPTSEIDHSRDFMSPVLNWFFFAGGYHTAHHLRPGVHWSELAALHERVVAPHKRADLSEYSMVGFFARNYVGSYLGERAHHEPAES